MEQVNSLTLSGVTNSTPMSWLSL